MADPTPLQSRSPSVRQSEDEESSIEEGRATPGWSSDGRCYSACFLPREEPGESRARAQSEMSTTLSMTGRARSLSLSDITPHITPSDSVQAIGPTRSSVRRPVALNMDSLAEIIRQERWHGLFRWRRRRNNHARFILDEIINDEMHRLDHRKDNMRALLEGLKDDLSVGRVERVKHALGYRAEVKSHVGNLYYGLLWMRFPVALLGASLLCFSLISGLLVDFLITAIEVRDSGTSNNGVRFVSMCVYVLPVITILSALFIHQGLELFFDSIDATPLAQTRARLLAALGVQPDAPPSKRMCWIVDLVVLMWFEVCPFAWMFFVHVSYDIGYWSGYVSGVLVACSLASIWLCFIGLVLAFRSGLVQCRVVKGKASAAPLIAMDIMVETIQASRMKPGLLPGMGMRGKHQAFVMSMTPVEAEHRLQLFRSTEWLSRPEVSARRPRLWTLTDRIQAGIQRVVQNCRSVFVGIAVVAWLFVCWLSFGVQAAPTNAEVLMVGLFFSVFALAFSLVRLFNTGGTSFLFVAAFLLALQVGLLYTSQSSDISAEEIAPAMVAPHARAANGEPTYGMPTKWTNDPQVAPYPVCRLDWGGPTVSLTGLDMAALSWVVYEPECDRIPGLLTAMFSSTGRAPVMEFCNPYSSLPRTVVVYFPGPSGGNGTRVISVKGTSTKKDFYADVTLYGSVQVMQWFSVTIEPLVHLLPQSMIEKMIYWQHAGSWYTPSKDLMQNVSNLEYFLNVSAGKLPPTDGPPLMTGHSLGGGLASVVAMRLGWSALVFSAPGNVYTSHIFNVPNQRAQKYVNVIPDNDIVPRVDEHNGVVQRILCRKDDGSQESIARCHRLTKTTCELWRLCGDAPYYRNFTSCPEFMSSKWIGKEFPDPKLV